MAEDERILTEEDGIRFKAESEKLRKRKWKKGWDFDQFIGSLSPEELLIWMRNFHYQLKYKHGKALDVEDEDIKKLEADLAALEAQVAAKKKYDADVRRYVAYHGQKPFNEQVEDILRQQSQKPFRSNKN